MGKIILLLFTTFLSSASQPLHLQNSFDYFHDKTSALSHKDILNKPMTPAPSGGFFEGNVWLKTKVCNQDNVPIFLVMKDPIDELDLYIDDNSSDPVSHRFLGHKEKMQNFWIKLPADFKGCKQLLIRVQSGDVVNFNFILTDEKSFRTMEISHISFYSFYYVLMLFALGLALVFLVRLREKVYLWFSMIIVFQDLLGGSLLNGYLFRFFVSPENFVKYDLGNIFAPLMNISVVAFTLVFLKINNNLLILISRIFIASQVLVVTPILLGIFFPIHTQFYLISQFVNYSILLSCILVLILALSDLKERRNQAFIILSSAKIMGQFCKTLLLQGDITESIFGYNYNFLVYNIAAIGSLIEVIGILLILIIGYFSEIEQRNKEIRDAQIQLQQFHANLKLLKVYRQVAHDIRSPLAALNVVAERIGDLPKGYKVLLNSALFRIEGIANDLLRMSMNNSNDDSKSILISDLLEEMILEKQALFSKRPEIILTLDMTEQSILPFAKVDELKLKRVISNLIDNSAEAIQSQGFIRVKMEVEGKNLRISVIDNGRGMSKAVLDRLGQEGFSCNKPQGFGLGVFNALSVIQSFGGTLSYDSQENVGTTATIVIPLDLETTSRKFR